MTQSILIDFLKINDHYFLFVGIKHLQDIGKKEKVYKSLKHVTLNSKVLNIYFKSYANSKH